MKEPKFRYPTEKSVEELSIELDLIPNEQDWEFIAGRPEDIENYISHYITLSDSDKKFTLMEVIIQAVTDQRNENDLLKYWDIVRPLIKENFKPHEYSVFYWCSFETKDINDCWKITPYMRQLFPEMFP